MYYLYEKAFQLTEYGYANTIGVFLAVMIAIVSFVQFKVLGNDVEFFNDTATTEIYTKETFNSLHCYFNHLLAFIDCTLYLSILLDFDRGLQITT